MADKSLGVAIDGAEGQLLMLPQGIAGAISGHGLIKIPGFSLETTVKVEFNRLAVAVNEVVGGKPLTLQAGPFVRVAAYDTTLTLGGFGIKGDWFFEQATSKTGTAVTKVAVANLAFNGLGNAISGAKGALVMYSDGIPGVVLGTASLPGASGSLGLLINTTGRAVTETITVNGVDISIVAAKPTSPTDKFEFLIQDLAVSFGDILEIHGDFRLSSGSFFGTNLEVFVGHGPSTAPGAIGILITNATVSYRNLGNAPGDGFYA